MLIFKLVGSHIKIRSEITSGLEEVRVGIMKLLNDKPQEILTLVLNSLRPTTFKVGHTVYSW